MTSELSDKLRRRIASLRPDWEPALLSGFLYLEGGYSNDNYRFEYRGQRYVLRSPYKHRAAVDRHLERALYDGGGDAGMPELVAFDADSGDMISRWVPGTLLADRQPDADMLVDYLAGLHRRMPPVTRIYDPLAHSLEHLGQVDAPAWVESLAGNLEWSPPEVTGCHNDLNPWNVICAPEGRWVTLDWEWAGRNDPMFDLVTLHQTAGLADAALEDMSHRFLGAPADERRLHRCLTVFWLRETTWAMAEIAAGNDRPEVVEQRRLGLERLSALAPP